MLGHWLVAVVVAELVDWELAVETAAAIANNCNFELEAVAVVAVADYNSRCCKSRWFHHLQCWYFRKSWTCFVLSLNRESASERCVCP